MLIGGWFALTQGGSDDILAHSHSSREGPQSHGAHTHASYCLLPYLQIASHIVGLCLSALLWHTQLHLVSLKENELCSVAGMKSPCKANTTKQFIFIMYISRMQE